VTNEKFTFRNIPKIFSHVVEKEGFLSLWKGNSAMILRIAPYAALQFMTYEQMKAWFVRSRFPFLPSCLTGDHRKTGTDNSAVGSYSLMISELMVCGGVAGAVSSAATYPLDLARSRLAVELNCQKSAIRVPVRLPLAFRDFIVSPDSLELEGVLSDLSVGPDQRDPWTLQVRDLVTRSSHSWTPLSGITPTILGIIPYGAISFTTNEVTKRMVCGSHPIPSLPYSCSRQCRLR
jgi:hypothetical protein